VAKGPRGSASNAQLAEASYAFAAKLFADQRRLMEELTKAMMESQKKGA
jgi:hypothetical protein